MLKKQTLIPAFLWGFFILYLTLKPKSSEDSHFPLWLTELHPDKIAHFVFWGCWYLIYHVTYLKYISISEQYEARRKEQFIFIVIAFFIGGLVEILQLKLNWGRSAEWLDLIADCAGVITSVLFFKMRENQI